jgi:hypothetical protein
MSSVGWVVIAFIAGYLYGRTERVILALLFGKDTPMRLLSRILGHRTEIATWAIVTSLLFTSFVGAWVVFLTSAQVGQKHEDTVRTDCSIDFNRLSALARDDRLVAQSNALRAQIASVRQDHRYQLGLKRSLTSPDTTIATLIGVIGHKIDADTRLLKSLIHQQRVSATHAYPPPNYCEETRTP